MSVPMRVIPKCSRVGSHFSRRSTLIKFVYFGFDTGSPSRVIHSQTSIHPKVSYPTNRNICLRMLASARPKETWNAATHPVPVASYDGCVFIHDEENAPWHYFEITL